MDSAKAAGEALVRQAEAHLAAVEAAAQKFVDDAAQALTAVGDGISDLAGKVASSVVGWNGKPFSFWGFFFMRLEIFSGVLLVRTDAPPCSRAVWPQQPRMGFQSAPAVMLIESPWAATRSPSY